MFENSLQRDFPLTDPLGGQSHPRYLYSFGAYALNSSEYNSSGLFKFDPLFNCRRKLKPRV